MLSDQNKALITNVPGGVAINLRSITLRLDQIGLMLDAAREEGRQSAGDRVKALEEGIKRLSSMEAFEGSRSIDLVRDAELLARIDYARALLSPQAAPVEQGEGCLTREEQSAQALRCSCRGADEWCVCQNSPDLITRQERNQ